MVFQVERSLDVREFLVDAGTVDSDLREDRPRSSTRLLAMSHRGLSGVGNKRKKNNAEGTT